ncbi:hypothetical protein DFQ01_1453 [Paenibacillus cellulosilyticus]|uniref:Uncharacterized protein n=1 Tax=Paenibacillus cellulosilyticus TaxID=375489 RepID=A0A2V2YLB3_9BACL|nr:hypothetical protein [Paenibacillus cellulosilyticus]PWV89406.1 hypothetical protein DFQ01_1453 [Paenibacillus cellulosilyticus]QKS47303.1 hypothetical protein HUB94_23025 [Paenibacillus cellulosilyticus]
MGEALDAYYSLVRNNLIRQMRSYSFLLIVLITLFVGYASVPSASDGYQVFYIGGVRGIYNSAWLGGMVTMLSTLLVWLFAFFMLRSQISEDGRLKVGQIVASTPVSNFRYIASKAISNFVVLVAIEVILFLAFMVMQLIRGESYQLQINDYLSPFVIIVMPSMLVLAALTVFFDVFPGIKGVIGNIIFFALWICFSVISIASPNNFWDVFGLESIRTDMVQEATLHYPFLATSEEGGSFGYYSNDGDVATFIWQGVDWDSHLLTLRLIWACIAICILILSSLVFNRFRNERSKKNPLAIQQLIGLSDAKVQAKPALDHYEFKLTPVSKERKLRIGRLARADLFVMLKDNSIWWYIIVLGCLGGSLLLSLDRIGSWMPVVAVLPIALWSQMGTREKYHFTWDMIASSCPPLYRFFSVWFAGIAASLLVSAGVLVRYAIEQQWSSVGSWLVAAVFIPTLAMTLGMISGSRKLFEVLYMLLWYLGPINDIPYLDFLGATTDHSEIYAVATVILLAVALFVQQFKEKRFVSIAADKERIKQYSEGGMS